MSKRRFEAIGKCLHTKDYSRAPTNPSHPKCDKLVKMRWLVKKVRETCVANWRLEYFVTIDELKICYKGSNGHGIKQYMPNKLIKFGFNILAAMDSKSKYLHNFQVYPSADVKNCMVQRQVKQRTVAKL